LEIVTVIGARPQFVKASVVSQALKRLGTIREYIIHTGQHYDSNMSDVFFDELGIPKPDCFLGIGSSSHGQQTGRMLEGIEGVLMNHRPDLMLVYGDTNSTLAGALAADTLPRERYVSFLKRQLEIRFLHEAEKRAARQDRKKSGRVAHRASRQED